MSILLLFMCQKETHGKACLCRVQKKHTANHGFTVCYIFTVCAPDKEVLYYMPDKLHTVNFMAHGKHAVSGIGVLNLFQNTEIPGVRYRKPAEWCGAL